MTSLRFSEFVRAPGPIRQPVTKFGGLPVWVAEPQWPLSRSKGTPMQFLAQVVIDAGLFPVPVESLAYLFVTGDLEVDNSLAGEQAVIIQQRTPTFSPRIIDGPQCQDYFLNEELELQARVFEALATTNIVPTFWNESAPEGWLPLFRLHETIVMEGKEMNPWMFDGRGICDVFLSPDGLQGLARMVH